VEKIKIRQATVEDAEQIVQIAESLKHDFEKVQTNGFLVYVLKEEEYRSRIRHNPYFYVSQDEGGLSGFLMAYDNSTLRSLDGCAAMQHEFGLVQLLLHQKPPFIFADQMGVRAEVNRSGVGRKLMKRLFHDMKKAKIPKIYAGVLHEPTRNQASINFCEGLGFNYTKREIQNPDGYIWGVYARSVGGGEVKW
jgi:N-acetylglutamate synthase-like GNAT family acetyltransferase